MNTFIRKIKSKMELIFTVLACLAGVLWLSQGIREHQTQQAIAEKILRFHVRANSNSSEDQALKLKVRDAVGSYLQQEIRIADAGNLEACRAAVQEHLPQIIDTARQAAAREGYDYSVTAQVETVRFPEKTYGSYTFPEGDYEALDVVIGAGKGHNWWCVMYPNICFHGAVYEVDDAQAEQPLQEVLSEDEYDAVLKSGKYKIRFKYLDFLNRILHLE